MDVGPGLVGLACDGWLSDKPPTHSFCLLHACFFFSLDPSPPPSPCLLVAMSSLVKGKSAVGSPSGSARFEAKGKSSTAASSSRATKRSTASGGKAEKKVYSLLGQKFDPPEETEPVRIFYDSLSKQIPSSEMAEFWLMEHGLLSPERTKKAYEKKQKRQQQIRMGTPIKPTVRKDKLESSKAKQVASRSMDSKAKKRVDYRDDDFIVKMKRTKG